MRIGVFYGLGCYLAWGVIPIYFKAVKAVPPLEVLAHRVIWSVVFLAALLQIKRGWPAIRVAISSRRTMLALIASTLLIACNWYTFIWAVGHDQVVQASLGYYINPLVSVVLGFAFLRERMRKLQWVAVAIAACAVVYLTIRIGKPPAISLILAMTFGLYGLLRKVAAVGALPGLAIETTMLAPIAVGFLVWRSHTGQLVFLNGSTGIDCLLAAGGIVTAVPLLWFANAARRLRLSTIGIMQYIAPTMQLVLGALIYSEPTGRHHWITFAAIWGALLIYTLDALSARRNAAR
ncbi:MAG: EamA family transporter RarD [Phycisphaerales bacterium]|nr:EamA family transporter RarD [Phycisphaerales bacterium]